ncbi:MAG: formimidoylglutamase [Bacteroidales bacterium]|nr:formimidoylglutamase [Bacteroidales bacterium]
MNIKDYFSPVDLEMKIDNQLFYENLFGNNLLVHTLKNKISNINKFKIAILGIPEERGTKNIGCKHAPDKIRNKLYYLTKNNNFPAIVDLGNFRIGKTINDTYIGLRDVIIKLLNNDVLPVIIGGSENLLYSCFLANEELKRTVNVLEINSHINIGNQEDEINEIPFLGKIIKSKYFKNFTNVGYQGYFVPHKDIALMKKLYFDTIRLGEIRSDLKEVEPIIRDSEIISININSVKQSDAPGYFSPSPNGFYSEEICQIAKFAGMSEKVSCFSLFDVNPDYDINEQTSHLAAQIIWHFIDGFCQRTNDFPFANSSEYTKYVVNISNFDTNLIFYKSKKSMRWWLEIPETISKTEKNTLIACSYNDYKKACENEMPERFWKFIQKSF